MRLSQPQPATTEPEQQSTRAIDMVALSRTLLQIIAQWDKSRYTDEKNEKDQTDVHQHTPLATPATDLNRTSQD